MKYKVIEIIRICILSIILYTTLKISGCNIIVAILFGSTMAALLNNIISNYSLNRTK